ncbi:MAG: hypothetical protein LQ347_002261 [Umbilicaria vellea]|nr:MAG: hypothetical protein LQ347_002261 [Umbilicaria vellea]
MPTYRSITVGLVSQFDILTIPEYAPPLHPNDPFSPSPTLINEEDSLVSVYIPAYASSQFWLSYSISPPHPRNALYYFKLFHNGVCVVSWGCGKEDGYRGKTMFGLFDAEQSWYGDCGVEKRAFCFAREDGSARMPSHNLGNVLEVRVYRSKDRQMAEPELTKFKQFAQSNNIGGIGQQDDSEGRIKYSPTDDPSSCIADSEHHSFVNAGMVTYKHPRRYYKYALHDPLDHPFATFRWYYRTWGTTAPSSPSISHRSANSPQPEELESMGVVSPETSTATASIRTAEKNGPRASNESERHSTESSEALTFYTAVSNALSLNTGAGPDTDSNDGPAGSAAIAQAPTEKPSLPAPPSPEPTTRARFHPSTSLTDRSPTPMPSSTHSSRKRAPTPMPGPSDHPHSSRFTEWLRRTPSPGKRGVENPGAETASAGKPRGNSMGTLRGVVAAAVKRKVAWRSEER